MWYQTALGPGESWVLRLSLTPQELRDPLAPVEETIRTRRAEADEFYETVYPPKATAEERRIQRQALAGILCSKLFYYWDFNPWLEGDMPKFPPPDSRELART